MVGVRIGIWAARCAGLAALVALGGCGGGGGGNAGFLSGVYGSAAEETTPNPNISNGVTVSTAAEPGRTVVIPMDPDKECPQINVPTGMSSYAAYAGEPSPSNVRHQMVLSDFARECTLISGTTVGIRVGVGGRVLLGEKGSPGTFSAPLTITVRDRDTNPIYSKTVQVSATVPPGDSQGTFKYIANDIVIPLQLEKPLRYYEIQLGFGGKAAAAAPARKKRRA